MKGVIMFGPISKTVLVFVALATVLCTQTGETKQQFADKSEHLVSKRFSNLDTTTNSYNPVLFIPGDGGSQLEAKLNKTEKLHYICDTVSDWYDIWLNVHLLVPIVFDCLCDNLKLKYNVTTRTTHNTDGVEIRARDFGALEPVANLDILKLPKTDYFERIIKELEQSNKLTRDYDMIGASFDFRKAPNELQDWFEKLTELIQVHYAKNNYRPVTLICHSMGCLNSLYLLNRQSAKWKEVFIRRLITLGAPWGGSFKAISAMLFGDNLGVPLLDKQKLQELQSTFPSLMYLFPRAPTFAINRVLVSTPTSNYTLKNLDKLFIDANLTDQLEMWRDTISIAANLKAPNVELWCLYGAGIETPSGIIYSSSIADGKYHEEHGDGDGTVNLESLRACELFQAEQEKPVYTRLFEKVDHIEILRGDDAAKFISTQILPLDHQ